MKSCKEPLDAACRLIYATVPGREEALRIGRQLVEERLAACANVLPGMEAVFRWKGCVESDREAVLILKTTKERAGACLEMLRGLHSYETPCAVCLAIETGLPETLQWIADSVAEDRSSEAGLGLLPGA
jgi:periplasmic divalent cation tolerance protein